MTQKKSTTDYHDEFNQALEAYESEQINAVDENAEAEQIRKDEFIKAYNDFQDDADSYRDDHPDESDEDDYDERLQNEDELAYIDHKLNEVD